MGRSSNRKWLKRANNLKLDLSKYRPLVLYRAMYSHRWMYIIHPGIHPKLNRALSLLRSK